ncbi:MAG: [FeFe] hydrogenase H-cluster radical SAM maturase HydE [Rickettsiales bacterium]|jgi:biotin synthase|nr:[FeFe] hydrogenase H-cluster radical SAM maturase HydE [Rickettsiales bacterium]
MSYENILNKRKYDKSDIIELLSNTEKQDLLFKKADEIRKKYVGDKVHLRGLMEFSNICQNNCLYCGIRKDNDKCKRYRLSIEQILDYAKKAVEYGFKTIVMQSGEDLWFDTEKMCFIIKEIKKMGVALTLSIGEKNYDEYEAYRKAGADRYLIRIETTDKKLYHKLDPNMSWENRHKCLLSLKELGYEVGSGIMVGLPEQTIESIADDLLYLKEMDIDMAGIGPFIPHPNTPLRDEKGKEFELSLRTMAIMRIMLPDINIPATTAMESLNPNGRIIALQSGANVVMPMITEGEYRKLYELYPNKICTNDTPLHCKTCIGLKIMSIGRTIGTNFGERKRGTI